MSSTYSALVKLQVIADVQICGTAFFKGNVLYMDAKANRVFKSGRDTWRVYKNDGEFVGYSREPHYELKQFLEKP